MRILCGIFLSISHLSSLITHLSLPFTLFSLLFTHLSSLSSHCSAIAHSTCRVSQPYIQLLHTLAPFAPNGPHGHTENLTFSAWADSSLREKRQATGFLSRNSGKCRKFIYEALSHDCKRARVRSRPPLSTRVSRLSGNQNMH